MPSAMREGRIRIRGLDYVYLEQGAGPLVVFIHGYPDDAHSWERQLGDFADAGYRALAPFMRGYPPTEVRADGYFDRATLASDVVEIARTFGEGEAVRLVGQDWGAAIAYGVLGAFPELIERAATLAVPHPVEVRRTLRREPRQAVRSFHWFLFQLPWLPERMLRAFDARFVEFLWKLWSPAFDDYAHVRQIRDKFLEPGVVEATLGYYRALFRRDRIDPALADVTARLDNPIRTPTLVLMGGEDKMRCEMLPRQKDLFVGPYETVIVAGAGHFLHRERPDEVSERLLDWFDRPRES
jgi:pimeloyl-ACP methyl ester carboxylesterase